MRPKNVGPHVVTGDARQLFDLEHVLSRNPTPLRDGRDRQTKLVCEPRHGDAGLDHFLHDLVARFAHESPIASRLPRVNGLVLMPWLSTTENNLTCRQFCVDAGLILR